MKHIINRYDKKVYSASGAKDASVLHKIKNERNVRKSGGERMQN